MGLTIGSSPGFFFIDVACRPGGIVLSRGYDNVKKGTIVVKNKNSRKKMRDNDGAYWLHFSDPFKHEMIKTHGNNNGNDPGRVTDALHISFKIFDF